MMKTTSSSALSSGYSSASVANVYSPSPLGQIPPNKSFNFSSTGGASSSLSSSSSKLFSSRQQSSSTLLSAAFLFNALRRQANIETCGSKDSLNSASALYASEEKLDEQTDSPPDHAVTARHSNLTRAIQEASATSNVSPQILRKTQNRLYKLQNLNKLFGSVGSVGELRSSTTTSASAASSSQFLGPKLVPQATVEEADTGITYSVDYDEMESTECSNTPSTSRFPLRKLRARQTAAAEQPVWRPTGPCCWRSSTGQEVVLNGIRIEYISDVERFCLQKLAFALLRKANLSCTVTKPKESGMMKCKRLKYVKRKAHTVNVIEQHLTKNKKSPSSSSKSLVFGIPLSECIQNDMQSESEKQSLAADQSQNRCKSLDLDEMENLRVSRSPLRLSGDSSKSSLSSFEQPNSSTESATMFIHGNSSKTSLNTQDSAEDCLSSGANGLVRSTSKSIENLLTAFSAQNSPGPTSVKSMDLNALQVRHVESYEPHSITVPKIVQNCVEYLQERGLTTVGIFRVNASVKRCRQMRLVLDSGQELIFTEENNDVYPHDVANLLKEFFKELPNPLLTKELYSAFVSVTKLPEDRKIEVCRLLVAILPSTNIDTLIVLMKFLQQVVGHSYDTINDEGIAISGNKMNSYNLATIFGPNILRPGLSKQTSLSDNDAVISVVETLIDNCDSIFMIPAQLQHQLYCSMVETEPDALDAIMFRLLESRRRSQDNTLEHEEAQATIYYTTKEKVFPQERTKDGDGTTIIKTKTQTTHKIVYKIQRETGAVVESNVLGQSFPPARRCIADSFPDLRLCCDDTQKAAAYEPVELIDPTKFRQNKQYKSSPLSKKGFTWSFGSKEKDQSSDVIL